MKLIDNVTTRLGDDLKEVVKKGSRISIAAASFSIYAYEALKQEFGRIEKLRFIFTSPTFIEENFQKETRLFHIPNIYKEAELCGGEFEVRLKNRLTQRAIAKECSKWIKGKVSFKSNRHVNRPIHSLIHVENASREDYAYLNICAFSAPDLGISPNNGFPSLIQKNGFPESQSYLEWFNQIWENEEDLQDVTSKVQSYFENLYRENSPEFIYFITLYNIFNDFLSDISSNLPNERVGLKSTQIWKKLYNFQQDAVIGAINKLEKYNGCVLADSVGLGKTFSALAVIKYYEMRNKDVLVLCPKRLEENWNTYRNNDTNNIFAADRLRYDVLFHTDLSRETGRSNGRILESVNWGNYGLVVIDESHNFRNNIPYVGRENRYQKLLRKIIREGIETKVLMLSATPVNNRFNDLKNQLALAYEGNPSNVDEKLGITIGIEQVFKRAQQAFNSWSRLESAERTTENLLNRLDFDFFKILDSLTIARSRKHITTYYDMEDIGRFPERKKPISIESPLCEKGEVSYEYIANELTKLNLAVYSPLHYVLQSKQSYYAEHYDYQTHSGKFTQMGRERNLQILMRINLLKRLESSVDSFRITLERVINQIDEAILVISNRKKDGYAEIPINDDADEFDWEDEENMIGKKIKIRIADLDTLRWEEDLKSDMSILNDLREKILGIKGEKDTKLKTLFRILDDKIENPPNLDNRKIIIFTAFADTAAYLYNSIHTYLNKKHGLHTALITGDRKTSNSNIPDDFNKLLTSFSPLSKDKKFLYPNLTESIDILIATDCISEGQNLQDCDYLINYDIHWNPVRIIQRFGRIDRIGSKNESITLVNFWPDITLDKYINLKQRVESRMTITAMTSTGDENILNMDEKDLEYRKIQLQRLKDEVVDIEDLREGISITDLGLNDFRVDLSNYLQTYGDRPKLLEGLHAVAKKSDNLPSGVIFVLKNINANLNVDKQNRLHPFYLVYIKQTGEIYLDYTESKKILDAMRILCKSSVESIPDLCRVLSEETDEYHKMEKYSGLLRKSIRDILNTEEEKEVCSLFKAGGTTTMPETMKGIEDFNLVSFLIVR
jgi:SNF2 family DNA or RNA helicase